MFESAFQAAESAARRWDPAADPDSSSGCCPRCFHRYRVLVLDGPLQGLPHGVAHAVTTAIDAVVADRLDASAEQFSRDAWTVLLNEADREAALARRIDSARDGLILVALDELRGAAQFLSELRRRHTEPAMRGYLLEHRVDEVPEAWG